MRNPSDFQIPPLKGELTFQAFCLKLARLYWRDEAADIHGRSGQGQNGIDIRGTDRRRGHQNAAIQCKGTESDEPRKLSEGDVREEVEKAKNLTPKLDVLIIAYAGYRDAPLGNFVKALSDENEAAGLFIVELWPWESIRERAEEFPDLREELVVRHNIPIARPQLEPKRALGAPARSPSVQVAFATLEAAIRADQESPKGDLGDPVLTAKLDLLRDQVNAGEGRSVIKPLRDFAADLSPDAPGRIRYRAYATLGAALVIDHKYEPAAIAFDEAAVAEGDTADGHASAARAAVMRGQTEKAYREASQALESDPGHRLAAPLLVDTAPANVTALELEARVSQVADHPDVAMALARRFGGQGNHDAALRVARAMKETAPEWLRPATVGEAILASFDRDFDARIGAPQSPQTMELLEEARSGLEKSWAHIKGRSDSVNWVHIPCNLASVYKLLGREDLADAIVLDAYALRPDTDAVKGKAIFAFVNKGDLETAVGLADELAEKGEPDQLFLAAHVNGFRKDWPRVEHWAQKAYDQAKEPDQKASAAELLVVAAYRQKGEPDALVRADALRGSFDPSVAFERRVAEIARRLGDQTQLEAAQARLSAFDPAKLNALQRFELADAYADAGEWSKAADLWAALHSKNRPTEPLTRHLFALLRADRREDGRKLFESLTGEALKSREVLRLGAAIYDRSGLLPEALTLLDKALAIAPDDLPSRLDWVRLSLREGREEAVRRWVKRSPESFEGTPEDLMSLAQVFDLYGARMKGLRLGYNTLRAHWGHSEPVHMRYLGLFLMRSGKGERFLAPKEVAEDHVVHLATMQGEKQRFLIARGEHGAETLSPDSDFGKKLIGLKVGDEVSTTPAFGQGTKWKIQEIKHKYIDLLHEAMTKHETVFPNSRAFGHFHVDPDREDGFEPVFDQVRQRARRAQEVTKLYDAGHVPIDSLGKLLGVDAVDASLGLRFSLDRRLQNCAGTIEERAQALEHLKRIEAVIVDPLTIGIWNEIGLLEIVGKLNSVKVQVIQATRDIFRARADEAAHAKAQEGGSLEARGDKIISVQLTKEDRAATASKAAALDAWVRNHTEVIPTEGLRTGPNEDASDLLSPSSIDTIATAIARKTVFISEDRRIREVAHSVGLAASSWTQPFLIRLLQAKHLTREQYVVLLANLQRQKVGFVSVAAIDLVLAAEFGLANEFDHLCQALAGVSDIAAILRISESVGLRLWCEQPLVENKEEWITRLLLALRTRPDGVERAKHVEEAIEDALAPLTFPHNRFADAWKAYMQRWAARQILRDTVLGTGAAVAKQIIVP